MNQFSTRTTIILGVSLVMAGITYLLAVQTMAGSIDHPVRCTCHSHTVTCIPAANS